MLEQKWHTNRQDFRRDIVILGGSGFIGTRLASLLAAGGLPFRIGDLRQSVAFPDRWTQCDVRRRESLTDLVRGASAIVNLAAVHRDDVRPLSLYQETNVDGATQVCQAARNAGVRKIVFTSSVAVYGFQPEPVDENGPFAPFNEYGRTKLAAENVYRAWANEEAARSLVIVRPTVVFGEGNRGNVFNLMNQIASGRFLMVGKGKNIKSIAYVGNVAAFVRHVLGLGPGTHIFNYVDGPDMETRELVQLIGRSLSKNGGTLRIPRMAALAGGHILDGVAHITNRSFPLSAIRVKKFCETTQFLAKRVESTGFKRPHSLREGLERTIHFEFLQNAANKEEEAFAIGNR
jgi:GlcNAc-P-P-Und epimerase